MSTPKKSGATGNAAGLAEGEQQLLIAVMKRVPRPTTDQWKEIAKELDVTNVDNPGAALAKRFKRLAVKLGFGDEQLKAPSTPASASKGRKRAAPKIKDEDLVDPDEVAATPTKKAKKVKAQPEIKKDGVQEPQGV